MRGAVQSRGLGRNEGRKEGKEPHVVHLTYVSKADGLVLSQPADSLVASCSCDSILRFHSVHHKVSSFNGTIDDFKGREEKARKARDDGTSAAAAADAAAVAMRCINWVSNESIPIRTYFAFDLRSVPFPDHPSLIPSSRVCRGP